MKILSESAKTEIDFFVEPRMRITNYLSLESSHVSDINEYVYDHHVSKNFDDKIVLTSELVTCGDFAIIMLSPPDNTTPIKISDWIVTQYNNYDCSVEYNREDENIVLGRSMITNGHSVKISELRVSDNNTLVYKMYSPEMHGAMSEMEEFITLVHWCFVYSLKLDTTSPTVEQIFDRIKELKRGNDKNKIPVTLPVKHRKHLCKIHDDFIAYGK